MNHWEAPQSKASSLTQSWILRNTGTTKHPPASCLFQEGCQQQQRRDLWSTASHVNKTLDTMKGDSPRRLVPELGFLRSHYRCPLRCSLLRSPACAAGTRSSQPSSFPSAPVAQGWTSWTGYLGQNKEEWGGVLEEGPLTRGLGEPAGRASKMATDPTKSPGFVQAAFLQRGSDPDTSHKTAASTAAQSSQRKEQKTRFCQGPGFRFLDLISLANSPVETLKRDLVERPLEQTNEMNTI